LVIPTDEEDLMQIFTSNLEKTRSSGRARRKNESTGKAVSPSANILPPAANPNAKEKAAASR